MNKVNVDEKAMSIENNQSDNIYEDRIIESLMKKKSFSAVMPLASLSTIIVIITDVRLPEKERGLSDLLMAKKATDLSNAHQWYTKGPSKLNEISSSTMKGLKTTNYEQVIKWSSISS